MVLGAGEAVSGLAQAIATIVTTEITTIDLNLKPKKKKAAKVDAGLKFSIKVSPLTIMFMIAVQNYYETGVWDLGLHILPGIQSTLGEIKEGIGDIVGDLGTGDNIDRAEDKFSKLIEDKPVIAGPRTIQGVVESPGFKIVKGIVEIDWGKWFR
jgi:hypothetical protein